MTALLNVSGKSVTVTRPCPPLVVDLGRGRFAWIEHGHGFTLDTNAGGTWQPIVDAHGIGGSVLQAPAVAELVLEHGRPS